MSEIAWVWTQRCRLTGETNEVLLTEEELREIESQPGFLGWEPGELTRVES